MHEITNRGIRYVSEILGYTYSVLQERAIERASGDEFSIFYEKNHSRTKVYVEERLESLKVRYLELGYFEKDKNCYIVENPLEYRGCSLFDLAFSLQDRHNEDLRGYTLVGTDVSHVLRGAYNHGILQVIITEGMSQDLIEKSIAKLHAQELVSPFLLGQGLIYRKMAMGWKGEILTVTVS